MKLMVHKLNPEATMPVKVSGRELYSLSTSEEVIISSNEIQPVKTGLSFNVPNGYVLIILPSQKLAAKGLTIIGAPVVLDNTNTEELILTMTNSGHTPFRINQKMELAQCFLQKSYEMEFSEG